MSWERIKLFAIGIDFYADFDPDGIMNRMVCFQFWPFLWRLNAIHRRNGLAPNFILLHFGPLAVEVQY